MATINMGNQTASNMLLLDDGDASGAGANIFYIPKISANFAVTVVYETAAPTAATSVLQGSIDGTTWVDMGNTTDVSATTVGFAVTDKPYAYIRGNLTVYTAGSCDGVTIRATAKE